MIYTPTYLYIKQHSITGKLYFGKTTGTEIYLIRYYHGSGKHWASHIKTHGKEHVVTLWYHLYDNPFDLVADAMSLSHRMDIINSTTFLNLSLENGLGAGKHSNETKLRMSESHKGIPRPSFTEEHRNNLSKAKLGKPTTKRGPYSEKHRLAISMGRRKSNSPTQVL